MSSPPIYCSNCGTRHEAGSSFCSKCGAKLGVHAAPPAEKPSATVRDEVVPKLAEVIIDEGINQLAPLVIAKVLTILSTVASVIQSAVLTVLNTGRSFPQWFLLTWPLTFAVAVIFVVNQRVTKGSLMIVPIGAVILLVATWLGTAISGVRYIGDIYTMPQGALAVSIYLLQRMFGIYGASAFIISVLTGALIGLVITRYAPRPPATAAPGASKSDSITPA